MISGNSSNNAPNKPPFELGDMVVFNQDKIRQSGMIMGMAQFLKSRSPGYSYLVRYHKKNGKIAEMWHLSWHLSKIQKWPVNLYEQ